MFPTDFHIIFLRVETWNHQPAIYFLIVEHRAEVDVLWLEYNLLWGVLVGMTVISIQWTQKLPLYRLCTSISLHGRFYSTRLRMPLIQKKCLIGWLATNNKGQDGKLLYETMLFTQPFDLDRRDFPKKILAILSVLWNSLKKGDSSSNWSSFSPCKLPMGKYSPFSGAPKDTHISYCRWDIPLDSS